MAEKTGLETESSMPQCGRCRYGEFDGRTPTGQCHADFKIPHCIKRFLPDVCGGTLRSVDFHLEGGTCSLFEWRS